MAGGIGFLVYLAILYSLYFLPNWISVAVAVIFSVIVNYYLNNWWAFRDRNVTNHKVGLSKFSLLSIFDIGFMYASTLWLIYYVGLGKWEASTISLLIRLPVKYVVCYIWVYKSSNEVGTVE
jgi:putative flippase GtrA